MALLVGAPSHTPKALRFDSQVTSWISGWGIYVRQAIHVSLPAMNMFLGEKLKTNNVNMSRKCELNFSCEANLRITSI